MKIYARDNNSGFTLLEVMVAVAMLGMFLVPLLITQVDTVHNIRKGAGDNHG